MEKMSSGSEKVSSIEHAQQLLQEVNSKHNELTGLIRAEMDKNPIFSEKVIEWTSVEENPTVTPETLVHGSERLSDFTFHFSEGSGRSFDQDEFEKLVNLRILRKPEEYHTDVANKIIENLRMMVSEIAAYIKTHFKDIQTAEQDMKDLPSTILDASNLFS